MAEKEIVPKIDSAVNASPIVVVQKKNDGVRICGDYKVPPNRYVKQIPT